MKKIYFVALNIFVISVILFSIMIISCKKSNAENVIVIMTNCVDFASYIEMFNAEHENEKAVLVYKEDLNAALPELKSRDADIIAGAFLNNARSILFFSDLHKLITEKKIDKDHFYPAFFDASDLHTYLLPVSFNLPLLLYDESVNGSYIPESAKKSSSIDLNGLRQSAVPYNKKTSARYTQMGFGVTWNYDFLLLCAKLFGIDPSHAANADLEPLKKYLADFVKDNTSTTEENEFSFRYLYQQPFKQAASAKTLYVYGTSALFADKDGAKCSYLWLTQPDDGGGKILPEDDAVFLGKFKKSKNKDADVFIEWFFQEETQKRLLERVNGMNLSGQSFGFAGGFSALKTVNEKLPAYYPHLQTLPDALKVAPPEPLSADYTREKKDALIHELLQALP